MSLRLTLITGWLFTTAALAQQGPLPPAPRPPAAAGARAALPPTRLAPHGAVAPVPPTAPAADSEISGTVVQFLVNPNGDADGLLLSDGTQVAFPPHVGDAVAQALKGGDAVQVSGWRAPGVPVMRMQSLRANGRLVIDQPPAPLARPQARRADGALTELSTSGRIDRLLFNDQGDVHGVLMYDRTIVRFPPHFSAALTAQLQPGSRLNAHGWGSRGGLGTAIEATELGSGGNAMRPLEVAPPLRRPL